MINSILHNLAGLDFSFWTQVRRHFRIHMSTVLRIKSVTAGHISFHTSVAYHQHHSPLVHSVEGI